MGDRGIVQKSFWIISMFTVWPTSVLLFAGAIAGCLPRFQLAAAMIAGKRVTENH